MRMSRLAASSAGLLALAVCLATAAAAEPQAYASPEAVKPLAAGAAVPSVALRSVGGERVDLATLVAERGALLVFYRGGW